MIHLEVYESLEDRERNRLPSKIFLEGIELILALRLCEENFDLFN
jgi:hypothetical protein